ncbi:MAG: DUF4352 domain-containing protein [Oscillospiraceae bacterium]|nr:DUF4352 domain-containing protein [Oscillospiraceae bacterium]
MKRSRKNAALLLAALCGTALLSTGCGQNSSSHRDMSDFQSSIYSPDVPESRVSEDAPGEIQNGVVGTTVNYNDKVEVTLNKLLELDDVDKTSYRVLIAEMTITNKSSEKIDCSTLTHFRATIDGEESAAPTRDVQAAVAARRYYAVAETDLQPLNQPIQAGESVTGYAYIFAPTSWKTMSLVYIPYRYYNTDRIVFDINEGELEHYTGKLYTPQ